MVNKATRLALDHFGDKEISQIPGVVIVNDIDTSTKDKSNDLNKFLIANRNGDMFDNVPSCSCGTLVGSDVKGILCTKCNTLVVEALENVSTTNIFIRAPEPVEYLICPNLYLMLSGYFTQKVAKVEFNAIDWLLDPYYRGANGYQDHPTYRYMMHHNLKQGLLYFHHNFDKIMEIMRHSPVMTINRAKVQKANDLYRLIEQERDILFSKYVPVPGSSIFIIEDTATGKYTNTNNNDAMDAIRIISSIKNRTTELSPKKIEGLAFKAIKLLSNTVAWHNSVSLGTKAGVIRKNVLGSRMPLSGRAVITPIVHPHMPNELHIPWQIACVVFKPHVLNKLFKQGMTPIEAIGFIDEYTHRTHPILIDIFNDLIMSSPKGGIPCIFNRQPTLLYGSLQRFLIMKIKTDIHDTTISMVVTAVKRPNADFDGDQMNFVLTLDEIRDDVLEALDPYQSLMDENRPGRISSAYSIPSLVVASANNYLREYRT